MARKLEVVGYEAVKKAIAESLTQSSEVYVLFTGAKDKNGISWCPDCAVAEPTIEEALKEAPENSIFIYCNVGGREYWNNPKNEFKLDKEWNLTAIPTLIKCNSGNILQKELLLNDVEVVRMIFE